MKTGKIVGVVLAVAVGFGLTELAVAMAPQTNKVKIKDMVNDATAYIKQHPDDAKGYCTLGRIHFLAFSLKTNSLMMDRKSVDPAKTPSPYLSPHPISGDGKQDKPPGEEQLIGHLKEAIANLRKAIEKDGTNGRYQLELAQAMEKGEAVSDKIGLVPGDSPETKKAAEDEQKAAAKFETLIKKLGDKDVQARDAAGKELKTQIVEAMPCLLKHVNDDDAEVRARVKALIGSYWIEKTVPYYVAAYKLCIADDLKRRSRGEHDVAYPAAKACIRLINGETGAEKELLIKIEEDMKTLEGKQKLVT
ncbi:MAG: hypothetical protein HZA50_16095 [Planctomycetes bacterium]|nr:hypothetical protein [Planctomycetota bacterium]